MTRPNTDHVYSDAKDSGAFKCDHCGARHLPQLPMPLTQYIEQGRGFALMHRLCPKPEPPSRQMALPGTEPGRNSQPDPICKMSINGRHDVYLNHDGSDYCALCEQHKKKPEPGWEPKLEPIDASTSDPAPEIDPPGPYARFEEMYPIATDYPSLYEALKSALSDEQWRSLRRFDQWHPASGVFHAVARWRRIEKAHADAGKREPIAGLTLPRREPMPVALAELLGVKPKEKRGARPLTSPKRKRKGEATT